MFYTIKKSIALDYSALKSINDWTLLLLKLAKQPSNAKSDKALVDAFCKLCSTKFDFEKACLVRSRYPEIHRVVWSPECRTTGEQFIAEVVKQTNRVDGWFNDKLWNAMCRLEGLDHDLTVIPTIPCADDIRALEVRSVSEVCRTTHYQQCDQCDDLSCGDNMRPVSKP